MKLIIKTQILFLVFFIFHTTSCTAQLEKQTYTHVYDLHFTMQPDSTIVYPWRENGAYSNYSIPFYINDSGRNLFTMRFMTGFPFYNHLRTEYEQRILLPSNNIKQAVVEFEGKGNNIKLVSIILDAIGKQENILFSDTLNFIPDTVLNLASQSINLVNAELLNIRINAEGEIDKDAYITFSKLNIQIDGKPIDAFPIRTLPTLTVNEKTNFMSINSDKKIELEQISEINNKRIIALGESMHGNYGINNLAYQIMTQAVERLNCKLILLEMPMEKSFAYNRFIHDMDYKIDSTIASNHTTADFLKRLRIYNSDKTKDAKVKLFGIDYNPSLSSSQNSAIDIFDFITDLNQEPQIPEIDQFSLLLMKEDFANAINYLDTYRDKMEKLLTTEEIESILHILRVSQQTGRDGIERFKQRDYVMFLNAKFLIDKFAKDSDAKIIVYEHAAHINPISTYPFVPCTPFGRYMHEVYSDNYSPLLLLVGTGESRVYEGAYNVKNKMLISPPENSIEYLLSNSEINTFYTPLTSDFDKLTLSRYKGNRHIAQEFFPFNLYQRYNGIFFKKNADNENSEENDISFDEAIEKDIMKVKQRQKKKEQIQKRVQN